MINKRPKYLACCGLLIGILFNNSAFADEAFRYCGKLLWPSQREAFLPFPEGMEVSFSTEPKIAQIISKQAKYSVSFTFEDMTVSYRLLQDAVGMIIAQGSNQLCLQAGAVEVSSTGAPLTVSPIHMVDGKVVFEFAKKVGEITK